MSKHKQQQQKKLSYFQLHKIKIKRFNLIFFFYKYLKAQQFH